jgi:hypothetical protein
MKLLVSVTNYGTNQLENLQSVLNEYLSYKKYDVTVQVNSTVPLNRTDVQVRLHDPALQHLLTIQHRQQFVEQQDDFDLFLYGENDMLIKEESIDTFLKYEPLFKENECLGFLRYEMRENDSELYFPDLNPHWPTIDKKLVEVSGRQFWTPVNIHQGCWLLPKNKLKLVINYSNFLLNELKTINPPTAPGIIETANCGVFVGWPRGIIYKYNTRDVDDLRKCLVHHTSNKYCRLNEPIWQNKPGPLTFTQLVEALK